jgi:hypothetical protein
MKITIIEALQELLPNVEWNIIDRDLTTLEILSEYDGSIPTQNDIDSTITKLQNDYDLQVQAKAASKAALLSKLGITEDEARLLLG